jgi:ABC-2 type transport system permease protein
VANSQTYDKQDNDTDGPFDIGLKCEKTTGEETSVAVIYSCENLFTSSADNMVAGNNMKLFTASLGSFVSHESSVSIPVKNLDTEYLTVPQSTILILAFITTILLPFAFIIAGFVIWFKRRKK